MSRTAARPGQKGASGVAMAAILVLFAVAVPVIVFTVLTSGVFSVGGNSPELSADLPSATASDVGLSLGLAGDVIAEDTNADGRIERIVCTVTNTSFNGRPLDFTTARDSNNNGVLSDEANDDRGTVVSYADDYQAVGDIAWTVTQLGKSNGDSLLDPGERFQLSIDLSHLDPPVAAYTRFAIHIQASRTAGITIERTVPSVVDRVMALR